MSARTAAAPAAHASSAAGIGIAALMFVSAVVFVTVVTLVAFLAGGSTFEEAVAITTEATATAGALTLVFAVVAYYVMKGDSHTE